VPKVEAGNSRKRHAPKTKRPARSRRMVGLLLLVVGGAIIVDGLVGERGLVAMLRARQEYDGLSATIGRQRTENARLREEARRLSEDPAAIEEVARRELGLIKPGERLFIIKDIPPAKPSAEPSVEPSAKP
jgi:cell division protein FtsB